MGDISRIYAQFKHKNAGSKEKLDQYKAAVLNKQNVVQCDDAEMENMRKSLLFDSFETNASNVMHQNDVTMKTVESPSSSQVSVDTNTLIDDDDDMDVNPMVNNVLLPSIKSSIDKYRGSADLVQMLDPNEEDS